MPIQYADPHIDVPPGVNFLDFKQARAWVAACEIDKPWCDRMRQRFVDLVGTLPSGAKVLELGSGPACGMRRNAARYKHSLAGIAVHDC